MQKTIKISVLSNFIRLGISASNIYKHFKEWQQYKKKMQDILGAGSVEHVILKPKNETLDSQHRFFITVHFGIYQLIIKYLSNLFPDKKIICLLGQQRSMQEIIGLTESNHLNVEFVEVGNSITFLRKLIKFNKEGCVFISLIDIPRGVSDKNDQWVPFLNGKFKVKTGLLKIAEKLNLPVRFLISELDMENNDIPISGYTVEDAESIFKIFGTFVSDKPYLWDKIVALFDYYKSDIEDGIYMPFKIEEDFFLLDISTNKIHEINHTFYEKICALKESQNSDLELFENYKRQINEQTNINIRQAV